MKYIDFINESKEFKGLCDLINSENMPSMQLGLQLAINYESEYEKSFYVL